MRHMSNFLLNIPRVSIIGLGYVGLTTAVCFAKRGIHVSGYDVDLDKLEKISRGEVPFHEPGVPELLKQALEEKTFEVSQDALNSSQIIFVTVGTPSSDEDGRIDLSYIRKASETIGNSIKNSNNEYYVIVVKSTVVPGTTMSIVKPIVEAISGKFFGRDMGLAVNPEFLKEGSAVVDTFEPDRIVIGEFDERSGEVLLSLYNGFYGTQTMPALVRTNLPNAELIKYATNSFLATKISFINTIANICERVPDADVKVVAKGIGLDARIGERFLNAGLGFGGSCFTKDVKALIHFSKEKGYNPVILDSALEVNRRQPNVAVQLAQQALGSLDSRVIALLGLAFKPNTDDIREAVSLEIIRELLGRGANIKAYDPAASPNVARKLGNVARLFYADSAIDAISDADCAIIVTEWKEFEKLGPEDFLSRMRTPVVIDGRRIYDPAKFSGKLAFAAVGLGKDVEASDVAKRPSVFQSVQLPREEVPPATTVLS
jgi:UDPglucose 6-dehydrogenase